MEKTYFSAAEAAIDNGANSEAPNVIINARSSAAGQVFNKQLINELK